MAVLSPIGYRFGWWNVHVALLVLLKWAAIGAGVALVASLAAALLSRPASGRKGFGLALSGLIIGSVVAGLPAWQAAKARSLPLIHDITTDTGNPPRFVALAEVRKAAPNGLEYEGATTAREQEQAYPDITPHFSQLPPDRLFARAESVARASGWDIAAMVPAEGRIEATDTSLLYGFKDDVVIRITPTGQGSRLDMRSMSRVGLSDVGVNATRIRKFFERLAASGG